MITKFLSGLVATKLISLYTGNVILKIFYSFQIALVLSPFALLFEKISKWTIENTEYISWVCWAIFVDWVIGIIYHLKKGDFNVGKNAKGVSLKIAMAFFAGSLFEALPYFLPKDSLIGEILLLVTRFTVFLYPAGSAWSNASFVTGGKFPGNGWNKKIKNFNETLNLKSLNNGDKQENDG